MKKRTFNYYLCEIGFYINAFSLIIVLFTSSLNKAKGQVNGDFHLKVTSFDIYSVHIIWKDITTANSTVKKYFVEKNINQHEWQVIDSTGTDSLVDITGLAPTTLLNPYKGIYYSTESGTGGFLKNELVREITLLPHITYRVMAVLSNNQSIVSPEVSISGLEFLNQPISPGSLHHAAPDDCELDIIPSNYNSTGNTITEVQTCCILEKTEFTYQELTGYALPPGTCSLVTVQNNCQVNINGSDCNYLYNGTTPSYDPVPCCGHIGSCYAFCNCGFVTPGTAVWLPCNAVYTTQTDWLITMVTPLYQPLQILGTEISCTNNIETYCATTGGLTSYSWSIVAGGQIIGSANLPCVDVQWLTPGTYTLTLIAEVCNGLFETVSIDIHVLDAATPPFTVSPGTSVCDGSMVCFTPVNSGNLEMGYEWKVDAQTVALYGPCSGGGGVCGGHCGQYQASFAGSAAGTTYTISLLIYDSYGNLSTCSFASQTITVYTPPVSDFNLPTGCIAPGQLISMCALQPPAIGISWNWTINGGTPSAGNTKCINNVSWASPGNYDITLTVSNPGCTVSTTKTITISDPHVCCDLGINWNFPSYQATSSGTWTNSNNPFGITSPVTIQNTMVILTGKNIIIQGMEFQFGLNGKVIVQKGATLTLKGTHFTSSPICGNTWAGVEIWGTAGSYTISDHGILNLLKDANGTPSIIENAVCGVRNFDGSNFGQNGGILTADYARFIGNYAGIHLGVNALLNNASTNSSINNCSFTCPNPLLYNPLGGGYTRTFAGIVIIANQSINNMIGNHFTNAEYGIFSLDGKFNISNSEFLTCAWGIRSQKFSSGFQSMHIFDNNTFQEYYTGIQVSGGYSDQVTNCSFNLAKASQNTNYEGIRMESSGGFNLIDNSFYSCAAGITVLNSGNLGGFIKSANGNNPNGNYFWNCWRGIQAYDDNHRLNIKCNTFYNHQSGSSIGSGYSAAWAIYGSLAHQGSSLDPVSNQFDKFPLTRSDIYSVNGPGQTANFSYYTYTLVSDPLGTPAIFAPTSSVNVISTSVVKPVDACVGHHHLAKVPFDPVTAIGQIEQQEDDASLQMMVTQLVNWYLANDKIDEAISYLEKRGDPAAKDRLLALYLKKNSTEKAGQLVEERAGSHDQEDVDFVKLNRILINWQQNNLSPFNMSSEDEASVREIADKYNCVSPQAKAIIYRVFGDKYEREVIDTGLTQKMAAETVQEKGKGEWIASIKPNPAKDNVTINFTGSLPGNAELEIIDYTGRLIRTVTLEEGSMQTNINIAILAKGMYTVRLLFNKTPQRSKRFSKL